MKRDDRVGQLDHLGRDIPVHVKGDRNRDLLAQAFSKRTEKNRLARIDPFGTHGSVQEEADTVELVRVGRIQKRCLQCVKGTAFDTPAGKGMGINCWNELGTCAK